jgi:hypothetical protein
VSEEGEAEVRYAISIDERFCRGDWGAPKSDASNATIGIDECVYLRIQRLKLLTVNVRAGNAIPAIQGRQAGRPRGSDVPVRKQGSTDAGQQHPEPAHKACGQADRTGFCEMAVPPHFACDLAEDGRADVKDAQAQMRHSRSSTTLDIYQQFVPESQQRAVEKLSGLSKRVQ